MSGGSPGTGTGLMATGVAYDAYALLPDTSH